MKLINILSLFFLMLILSCEKDIKVDIPSFEQKLVATCWFTNEGNWYLKVTKTKYILDDGPIEIVDNAEVEIYEEDSLIEILPYIGQGIYGISNGYKAKVGKEYNLFVKSSGYPELSAKEVLLDEPNITDINIDLENSYINNTLIGYYANIYFDDNLLSNDYYHLLVYRDYITPIAIEINGTNYNSGDTIFNEYVHFHIDMLIDKICHIGSWFIEDDYLSASNSLRFLIDQDCFENIICFNFEIYHITENYYNYGKTLENFVGGSIENIYGSNTEPSKIKSNINNGYGIFAGLGRKFYKINID